MKAIFRFFAGRHLVAVMFTVMVLALGTGTLLRIQRDIFPEVDLGEMFITTRYPGASPEDVELSVTNPIEEEVRGVANLDEVVSYSMEGISIVTVTIDIDADNIDEIKDDVRRAVDRVTDLPQDVPEDPVVTELGRAELPILEVGVSGEVPYRTLRETARWFKRELLGVKGVSDVDEIWYRDREVKVKVKTDAIEEYELSLVQVASAIEQRNIRSTGGALESYRSEKSLVTLAQFEEPTDVAEVVVRSTFTSPVITVGDVAEIVDSYEESRVMSRINGIPAITFQVKKKKSADIIRTVDAVKAMAAGSANLLPDGVSITYTNDQSYYVRNRFNVVLNNGAIGLVLVVIILAVFLSLRVAFWVGLSIPVVLLGVVFLLPIGGYYLDIISLASMLVVLGIIVDDGIIVSEKIVQQRESGLEPLQAATSGTSVVFRPVVTTLLTTFLAFAPMFFMEGVVGEFVRVIPLVISLALFVSLLELVIALPGHLVPVLKRIPPEKGSTRSWFDGIRSGYRGLMQRIIRWRYVYVLGSAGLVIAAIWYAANYMPLILFPATAADTFRVFVELPQDAALRRTSDKVAEIEGIIAGLPDDEVESFASRIGSHGRRQPGESNHWGFVRVNLTPYSERERTADVIVDSLRSMTDTLSGVSDIFYKIDAGGPPVGQPITIRIIGDNDSLRRSLTDSVMAFLGGIDGVADLDRNDRRGQEQVEIDLDYEQLSRLGLTASDVARTVRIAFDGALVSSLRYGDVDIDYRVLLEDVARQDTSYLSELKVPNRQGRLISLGDVATLKPRQGPASYYHWDGQRATMITGDVNKDQTTAVQATDSVVNHFDLQENYTGMRFVVGGEAEETQESFESLYIAFGIAVVAIFFLLILLFGSVTQPLVIIVAIPFGVLSVIVAFLLHAEPLGFLAMMGLVGLSGVVVNDSLIMVHHINRMRQEDRDEPLSGIVTQGASDRLRAILMTTLTTAAGLIPLAYGLGGSDPFVAPMALALGYGLIFATPLTLALIPCLYVIHDDITGLIGRAVKRLRGDGGQEMSSL